MMIFFLLCLFIYSISMYVRVIIVRIEVININVVRIDCCLLVEGCFFMFMYFVMFCLLFVKNEINMFLVSF